MVFPALVGLAPTPAAKPTTSITSKPATRAQKLAKALQACRKERPQKRRVRCELQARKLYGQAKKPRKK